VARARKRFGQHFLEPAWVAKVIRAIDPQPSDAFLEIGPGRGALTRPLAASVRHVTAVEIDRDLASAVRAAASPNLTVIEGDFLDVDLAAIAASGSVRVAGNLPYNVASPILFRLVGIHAGGMPLIDATLMLQREVADRLVAVPGTRDYGVLTVLIGHSAHVKRVLALPPGAFRPTPKVHSALVQLRFHAPEPAVRNRTTFARLVQSVFTRRRKTLANAMAAFDALGPAAVRHALDRAAIDGQRRPETLTIEEFARLSDAMEPRLQGV
jgi:16S rRNA (adenine1518-N6/adenine1519-N6)-dimethyltransferase